LGRGRVGEGVRDNINSIASFAKEGVKLCRIK
jgi:hypothetical protein